MRGNSRRTSRASRSTARTRTELRHQDRSNDEERKERQHANRNGVRPNDDADQNTYHDHRGDNRLSLLSSACPAHSALSDALGQLSLHLVVTVAKPGDTNVRSTRSGPRSCSRRRAVEVRKLVRHDTRARPQRHTPRRQSQRNFGSRPRAHGRAGRLLAGKTPTYAWTISGVSLGTSAE